MARSHGTSRHCHIRSSTAKTLELRRACLFVGVLSVRRRRLHYRQLEARIALLCSEHGSESRARADLADWRLRGPPRPLTRTLTRTLTQTLHAAVGGWSGGDTTLRVELYGSRAGGGLLLPNAAKGSKLTLRLGIETKRPEEAERKRVKVSRVHGKSHRCWSSDEIVPSVFLSKPQIPQHLTTLRLDFRAHDATLAPDETHCQTHRVI